MRFALVTVLMTQSVLHYDIIIALLAGAWRTLACQTCELKMEILRSKAVFEATMFSKVFETQPQEELNCMRERTNTEDLYAVL